MQEDRPFLVLEMQLVIQVVDGLNVHGVTAEGILEVVRFNNLLD
ncbi:hypothetical protein [Algoriphagus taiwanensis]